VKPRREPPLHDSTEPMVSAGHHIGIRPANKAGRPRKSEPRGHVAHRDGWRTVFEDGRLQILGPGEEPGDDFTILR